MNQQAAAEQVTTRLLDDNYVLQTSSPYRRIIKAGHRARLFVPGPEGIDPAEILEVRRYGTRYTFRIDGPLMMKQTCEARSLALMSGKQRSYRFTVDSWYYPVRVLTVERCAFTT